MNTRSSKFVLAPYAVETESKQHHPFCFAYVARQSLPEDWAGNQLLTPKQAEDIPDDEKDRRNVWTKEEKFHNGRA